jgi:hypothetical protein
VLAASIGRQLERACREALAGAGADAPEAGPTVPRGPAPIAPAALAASLPGAERMAMQQVYERCLAHYRVSVRPEDTVLGIDDAGAAAAHFVAENLRALRGEAVDRPRMPRLQRQLGALVRATPAWAQGSTGERRLCAEALATLAVFVHEMADQALVQGDAAIENVRRAARGYLLELLGVDPDRIALGRDGLTLSAPGTSAPRAA